MEANLKNNYFPNYECGECVPHLAYLYDHISKDDLIKNNCVECFLYKKDIKILDENLYTYKNIFIEKVNLTSQVVSGYGFRVKNRETIHFNITSACDEIDEEIQNV